MNKIGLCVRCGIEFIKINDNKKYCKLCLKQHRLEYRQRPEVKERKRLYDKLYIQRLDIITKRKDSAKKYRQKNREKTNERAKKYTQRPYVKLKIRKYKQHYNNRLQIKLAHRLRNRIRGILQYNGKIKHNNTVELIGCSISELKQHLESQFTFGMNWKNYGYGWHIDHIIACKHFDLSKEEEQKKAFYYTNLQPMWASENLSKGDKYESS